MFEAQGLYFLHNKNSIAVEGSLKAGDYRIDGNISSQFISGLLFTLPCLAGDSVIRINPPFESASYAELTCDMLAHFGITVTIYDPLTIYIKGAQKYRPAEYAIEGDYSQFSFFAVLGALNGGVKCTGLNPASKQGDKAIIDILEKSGVNIERLEDGLYINKSVVAGSEIDLADCPDLGPVLNVLGMYANGNTRIYNASRLRYKECDRIKAMQTELLKSGVDIKTTESEIFIKGGRLYHCDDELYGHNDHRIVMSLAIAATLFDAPVIIDGAEAVNKSYPAFFEDLKNLNIKIEYL
jgi:3-phosphoshikimate 1-carboxyvinyltransferase